MSTDAARILIVDDDEPFRALVASLLERAGYATAEASTGEEALTSVRRETPACILLDVLLPRATGYEVCRELRDRYGEALPIVFVTGERTEPADRVAGLLIGADDYILKPFDPDELIARVRRLLVRSDILAKFVGDKRHGFQLTDRELEVLRLLAEGLEQDGIARELFISPKTVSTHIQRILTKLGVHSRAQAIAVAYRENLVAKGADIPVMH
jgi:two-component system, NarL family, nitrate/nitrite response regulator NarL